MDVGFGAIIAPQSTNCEMPSSQRVVHAMSYSPIDSVIWLTQTRLSNQRRSTQRDGHPRRLPTMPILQIQEKRPYFNVQPVSCNQHVMIQRLEVKADEMHRFVQKKANKQWIWLAMDVKTRQIIAFHVGDRSRKSANHIGAIKMFICHYNLSRAV